MSAGNPQDPDSDPNHDRDPEDDRDLDDETNPSSGSDFSSDRSRLPLPSTRLTDALDELVLARGADDIDLSSADRARLASIIDDLDGLCSERAVRRFCH